MTKVNRCWWSGDEWFNESEGDASATRPEDVTLARYGGPYRARHSAQPPRVSAGTATADAKLIQFWTER